MNGRAKILEIGPYPPPHNGWSMRIWVVKSALEKAGHRCVVLNLGENRKTPGPEYECVRNGWEYLRKLLRYATRGYVYHFHTNGDSLKGFLVAMIAYGVSLLAVRRPVLTFHGGTDQDYFPREKCRLIVPLLKVLFGAAKAVICDNSFIAQQIIDYGISPEKVFPISPFTRQYLDLSPQELDDDLKRFLKHHAPVVLTYVECRPEYDLDSLFGVVGELARQTPRLGLIVVGATHDTGTIVTLANDAGLGAHCLHLGAVDHGTFLSLLRRVSVYLRCARTEGTSASIREALFVAVPVVANNAESHPADVIVYPWGDTAAMLKAVVFSLENPNLDQASEIRSNMIDVPDTVTAEVEILVRCAGMNPERGRTVYQC